MYYSTSIMLEADNICSLIITSLKEGNIFYLKEEYIVLKIEVGHLSDWITIQTNVSNQYLPNTFRIEFKSSVATSVALASHPVIPVIPGFPENTGVLPPPRSAGTWTLLG